MIGTSTYSPHDGEGTRDVVPYAIRWATVDTVVFEIDHDGRVWSYQPDLHGLLRLAAKNLSTPELADFVMQVSDFMCWESLGLFSGVRMRLMDVRDAIETVHEFHRVTRWAVLRERYAELSALAGVR